MKPLPTNSHEYRSRAMSALIDDLFDRKQTGFNRLEAMRAVSLKMKERDNG